MGIKGVQHYSDETLVQAWAMAKDNYDDGNELLGGSHLSEKRRDEIWEDVQMLGERISELQDEMWSRGMFTDEDKPRLKREFKKYLALGNRDKPRDVEE